MRTLSFASYADLIGTLRTQLLDLAAAVAGDPAGRARLHAVLGSHPRLGEKKIAVEGGGLSGFSREEQRHLSEEDEELGRLNREYEERFPGLRYVVWVNGRGRGEVMGDMRRRIGRGDLGEVEREGIGVSFCLFSFGDVAFLVGFLCRLGCFFSLLSLVPFTFFCLVLLSFFVYLWPSSDCANGSLHRPCAISLPIGQGSCSSSRLGRQRRTPRAEGWILGEA
jgi:hypothetical protein